VTFVWAAIGVAALISSIAWSRYRRWKDPALGVVSHQWLAEQRQRSDEVSQRWAHADQAGTGAPGVRWRRASLRWRVADGPAPRESRLNRTLDGNGISYCGGGPGSLTRCQRSELAEKEQVWETRVARRTRKRTSNSKSRNRKRRNKGSRTRPGQRFL